MHFLQLLESITPSSSSLSAINNTWLFFKLLIIYPYIYKYVHIHHSLLLVTNSNPNPNPACKFFLGKGEGGGDIYQRSIAILSCKLLLVVSGLICLGAYWDTDSYHHPIMACHISNMLHCGLIKLWNL